MKLVGLTGGIGAGKSAAATHFRNLGVSIVDTDQIAHALTSPGGKANSFIGAAFGAEMLESAGGMARSKMRERIFADPAARSTLESILHPLIRDGVDEALLALRQAPQPIAYVLLAVPLLFERMTFRTSIWRTLLIDAPHALQRVRVCQRPGLDEVQTDRIIKAQAPREIRLQLADDVITNNADLAHLQLQVERIHSVYLKNLAASKLGGK